MVSPTGGALTFFKMSPTVETGTQLVFEMVSQPLPTVFLSDNGLSHVHAELCDLHHGDYGDHEHCSALALVHGPDRSPLNASPALNCPPNIEKK